MTIAVATAVLPCPALAQAVSGRAAARTDEAGALAAAFRDICLRTKFDPARAQSALKALGWSGVILQRPSGKRFFAFTHWKFPFGELQTGYRVIGGVELKTFSCGLVIKAAHAPDRADLEAALEGLLTPARFRDARTRLSDFTRVAPIKDRDDEQEFVGLVGDQVPLHAGGTFKLGPGLLVYYSYAKGPHAKELTGR